MDWPLDTFDIQPKNLNILKYTGRGSSKVLRKSDSRPLEEQSLKDRGEWCSWLSKHGPVANQVPESGLVALLIDRSDEPDSTAEADHNPFGLQYVPYDRDVFKQIAKSFHIHESIVRHINRSDASIFSRTNLMLGNPPAPVIVYNCRSSAAWAKDLALSITYFPQTRSTYAVLFGCDSTIVDEIARRIQGSQNAAAHPMLLVGIFAEIERRRYVSLVEKTVRDLLNRVLELSDDEQDLELGNGSENSDSIEAWLQTSNIRTSLLSWRDQLEKMIAHIDELTNTTFVLGSPSSFESSSQAAEEGQAIGQRIRERLEEIRCDYDEMIRKCTQSMDGMTLATQLSWNRIGRQDNRTNLKISESNLTIAEATKLDSHQMRKISVLTLVFLPATFVATLFSMTFFNWSPKEDEKMLSSYFWLYPVVTLGLMGVTAMVLYAPKQKLIVKLRDIFSRLTPEDENMLPEKSSDLSPT